MGGNGGGTAGAPSAEAMRARMAEALARSFSEFRDSLDAGQRERWDAGLRTLATARRGQLWVLVDGKPQPVPVRLGVSDGTVTEVSGVEEGQQVVTGQERPAQ
ncbi:hypothetical protein N790_08455 [Arenimonas malthae CC-JY-1]|uniref:Uncharacterized protein n=1 Tax=Arenimonas malthae CC-JY-1 TaxID=1384054 RepID=A0A091B483_9GAMM|nr:hypothetical protein N790_08455 [Arenimonas malthae CC-JY-1]